MLAPTSSCAAGRAGSPQDGGDVGDIRFTPDGTHDYAVHRLVVKDWFDAILQQKMDGREKPSTLVPVVKRMGCADIEAVGGCLVMEGRKPLFSENRSSRLGEASLQGRFVENALFPPKRAMAALWRSRISCLER